MQETRTDEVYTLAAQSHVQVSFETPEYTANSDALGTLRLLEAIRILGNLDSLRDWAHARDYVRAMYLMLQQDEPDDYVIATGRQHSAGDFAARAFAEVGVTVEFDGAGTDEVGRVTAVDAGRLGAACGKVDPAACTVAHLEPGAIVLRVDPRYFRPTEVETLLGDPTKAHEALGWRADVSFADLVAEMVREDLGQARRDGVLRTEGFDVPEPRE
jgi:GDPmannose 4,6-dehydratase